MKPPVLHMPNKTGRFHLYSDNSIFATGGALYQIQNGKPKLIAYASKRLPKAAKSYSITELELCGLAINTASFAHLLKRVDFNAIVDHLALTHIIKSKVELTTTRIKRLLELISSYSFNSYYMKGKDMIWSDYLSHQNNYSSNPSEIIPISFNAYSILEDNRNFDICNNNDDNGKYLIQTCSQAKTSSTKLPKVHGIKELDPNLRPEKQHAIPKQGRSEKPQVGQGRAGLRRRRPDHLNQPSNVTQGIPGGSKIEIGKTNSAQGTNSTHDTAINNDNPFLPDVPLHLDPLHKPSSLHQNTNKISHNRNINLNFEDNSPLQEGIISETI